VIVMLHFGDGKLVRMHTRAKYLCANHVVFNIAAQGAIISVLIRTGGTPILLSGTSLFSATYHVGSRNFCYLPSPRYSIP
jgi:hypothetical protein